jgi:SNF2 family DNA or RNA helicase
MSTSSTLSPTSSASSRLSPDLLHAYQHRAVDRLYGHNGTLAIMPMGAGKTISTATAVSELIGDGVARRALVIAPKRVAQMVWAQEIAGWEHTHQLTVAIALGTAKERIAALKSDAQVVVINYDNVKWMVDNLDLAALGFDILVLDEITKCKDGTTHRAKALRKVRPLFKIVIGLTGTPTGNKLMDIYQPADLVAPGVLGRSFYKFRQTYFYPLDPQGWKWAPKEHAEERIYDALAKVAFRMEDRDYVELPGITFNDVRVALPVEAARKYREMEDNLVAKLGDTAISAANGGVLVNKLRQITAGFLYDETGESFAQLHTAKLDAVEELIEELQGAPAIVVYEYKAELQLMQERLEGAFGYKTAYLGAGVSDANAQRAVDDWNAGKLDVLFVHAASAGHGLNLQRGGQHIIFASLTWSREMYDQVIARIYRQGQKQACFVHRVMVPDTVDYTIAYALDHKKSISEALLEGLSKRGASL